MSGVRAMVKCFRWIKRGLILILSGIFMFSASGVLALTQSDINSILGDTAYYDSGSSVCATNGSSSISSGVTGANGPVWSSNLQAPYYLEEFATNVLGDLAQKTGVPSSATVTQEHAVALIAWFWIEGGDIAQDNLNSNSPGLFNPLNTSIGADPSSPNANLVDRNYPVRGGGLESFVSFDAGVEATTLTFLGSLQNRIANALIDPSTTAEQVMKIITSPQNYPGNLAWAATSQTDYYNHLISSVNSTRTNYKTEASTLMGTTKPEALDGLTVSNAVLQFSGGTSSGGTGSSGNCTSGAASSIIQTAVGLAWPNGNHGTDKSDATSAYQSALPLYNKSTTDYTDCGGFVATVMHESQADNGYPGVYVPTQYTYVTSSSKYRIIKDVTDTSQLQPGDVLIYYNPASSDPGDSHTFIYVGQQAGFDGDGASASLGGHVPEAVNTAGEFSYNGRATSGNYIAVRLAQ